MILVVGFLLDFRVLWENHYASRFIEVQKEQKVIDTGLYALVRHPMYSSLVVIYLSTPLVLGSVVALVPSVRFGFVLVARIFAEEKLLSERLEGYSRY